MHARLLSIVGDYHNRQEEGENGRGQSFESSKNLSDLIEGVSALIFGTLKDFGSSSKAEGAEALFVASSHEFLSSNADGLVGGNIGEDVGRLLSNVEGVEENDDGVNFNEVDSLEDTASTNEYLSTQANIRAGKLLIRSGYGTNEPIAHIASSSVTQSNNFRRGGGVQEEPFTSAREAWQAALLEVRSSTNETAVAMTPTVSARLHDGRSSRRDEKIST